MKVIITTNISEFTRKLENVGPRVITGITDSLNLSMTGLRDAIVDEKLNGQVLKRRTGRLAASIQVIPAELIAGSIIAGVEGATGEAWYGKIHEFGGTFTRHSQSRLSGRSHGTGTVHFPERSFMRSTFYEWKDRIMIGLRGAIGQAVKS